MNYLSFRMNKITMFFLLSICLITSGCSYFKDRGHDFLDCFRLNVGAGLGAAADARVTFVSTGLLIQQSYRVGIDYKGMPDVWEERYGFNPYDKSDAKKDKDSDGYTNLEEYKIGTHPTKDIFIQNMSYRIKDSVSYLGLSVILFIILILLGYVGKRRIAS